MSKCLREIYDAMFDRNTIHGNLLIMVVSSMACLLICVVVK